MRYYARAFPPAGGTTGAMATLLNWFGRAHAYYFSLPRFKFEAMTLGLALLFGLLVVPPLIYLPGIYVLKPYANGGLCCALLRFPQRAGGAAPELLDRARWSVCRFSVCSEFSGSSFASYK